MYYKFRDFKNYKYLLDLILYQRLYSSSFKNLNDNFEGQFFSEIHNKRLRLNPLKEKHISICSFSSVYKNHLMWSHYADGHRGLVIGFHILEDNFKIHKVNYNGLTIIEDLPIKFEDKKDVFLNKIGDWNYENEFRIITDNQCYIDIEIKEIILGSEVSDLNKDLITKLIRYVNPKIEVRTYYD